MKVAVSELVGNRFASVWGLCAEFDPPSPLYSQPTGLEEVIGDEDSFSKGQRQLLCLARALLSKKKIIVLDESTSRWVKRITISPRIKAHILRSTTHSMDRVSDEKIRRVVETKMQGRTVLAIAHRICELVLSIVIVTLDVY